MNPYIKKIIYILSNTNDGNQLSPGHLYLLQCATNHPDAITKDGDELITDIYNRVKTGTYQKPWHCGVKHLTKDHNGWVYWKGVRVEHFTFRDGGKEKAAAEELGRICRYLERTGREINLENVLKESEGG